MLPGFAARLNQYLVRFADRRGLFLKTPKIALLNNRGFSWATRNGKRFRTGTHYLQFKTTAGIGSIGLPAGRIKAL
jgi:hypothetical protein